MVYFRCIMRIAAKIRLLLALAIIVVVVLLAVASLRRFPAKSGHDPLPAKESAADLEMKGVRFTETADGSTRWVLESESARYDLSRSIVALSVVNLTAAPRDKRLGEVFLSAPRASYNTETKEVYLSGGVRARTATGMKFSTSAAQFSGTTGVVTTPHPVSLSDATLKVEGTGMDFNVSTYKLRIKSDVTTVYKAGAKL